VRAKERAEKIAPCAIEFFDKGALDIISILKNDDIGRADKKFNAAVYVEAADNDEELLYDYFTSLEALVKERGEDPGANWAGTDRRERERLRLFRHAVPEAVNLKIAELRKTDERITKLATDFAVPDSGLRALISLYHTALDRAGFKYVMFGHIGNNHLHVNILPAAADDYEKGKKIFQGIAEEVIRMGGTISAEHGVGKLKRDFLRLMYGAEGIEEMKRLKKIFDPDNLLNRGNLFE
jgi:D-lactate dehydrogenase (cytochrome)